MSDRVKIVTQRSGVVCIDLVSDGEGGQLADLSVLAAEGPSAAVYLTGTEALRLARELISASLTIEVGGVEGTEGE